MHFELCAVCGVVRLIYNVFFVKFLGIVVEGCLTTPAPPITPIGQLISEINIPKSEPNFWKDFCPSL